MAEQQKYQVLSTVVLKGDLVDSPAIVTVEELGITPEHCQQQLERLLRLGVIVPEGKAVIEPETTVLEHSEIELANVDGTQFVPRRK